MIDRYTLPAMGQLWGDDSHWQRMLEVELLACEALQKQGLMSKATLQQIRSKARFNLKRIQQREETSKHDVIAFVTEVSSRVGEAGRFLHFGLTSSDVVDTALASTLKDSADLLLKDLDQLLKVLRRVARKHRHTVMVGRTHGVHAEPITFGLKLAVFFEEFTRHRVTLKTVRSTIAVGKISGAVGTYATVDPAVERYVCRKMKLTPAAISTQIIQRDRHAQFVTTLALIGASIERLAVEFRHLQRTEVREVQEAFGRGQKGSSAMPHKRNPITCERLTGLARLLRGYAVTAMENVALWHERDISHSSTERVILPDSTITLDYMLQTMTQVVDGLEVFPERMRANLDASRGMVFSQRVLLELIRSGMTRERAYEVVQRCAARVWDGDDTFEEALAADSVVTRELSAEQLAACCNLDASLKHVDRILKRVGIV